jgi:hypothetical protein
MVQKFQTGNASATENYVQRSDKIDPFSKMSMSIKKNCRKIRSFIKQQAQVVLYKLKGFFCLVQDESQGGMRFL